MTLVDPQYLDEIFGSLHMAGEDVRHFFLSLEVRRRATGSLS
jgi:hypothetical protein